MSEDNRKNEFLELFTLHQTQLYGYIYALVHNAEDAKDLFQTTSLILWRKFDQFTPGTNFLAWARRIAHYEVLYFQRRMATSKVQFSSELVDAFADAVLVESVAEIEDRQTFLNRCMKKLAELDHRLLELFYAQDRTAEQIGEELGRSRQSISNSLRRIRRALFACVRRELARERES